MAEWAWMVSFVVNEDGSLGDYELEEVNLDFYNSTAANKLRAKIGKGLFTNAEEARMWAEAQLGDKSCGCRCGSSGKGCGCPHKK